MAIHFIAMPSEDAHALQAGGRDAYGLPPERRISDGVGVPCRHCLKNVAAGDPYLIVAYRPFPSLQPYAETGAIFLHAEACTRPEDSGEMPDMLTSNNYIVRGYDSDNRIVYGTGKVVDTPDVTAWAQTLFERGDVVYAHVRSARNNCYQLRLEPAAG